MKRLPDNAEPIGLAAAGSPNPRVQVVGDGMAISAAVLEGVAARFRPAGLFLLLLRPDGSIAYADPAAGPFFHRYVLPALQLKPGTRPPLFEPLRTLCASPSTIILQDLPGIILAGFPHAERNQPHGIIALAARSIDFKLGEDVLAACTQLGLEPDWLRQHAELVPGYTADVLQGQTQLLHGIMRDQFRLANLQSELVSLSTQLSNAYEELSLIYQLSGGMRINRHADDFFKQACVEVSQVMGVQAMGVALTEEAAPRGQPAIYGQTTLSPLSVRRLGNELLAVLSHSRGPLLINDVARDATFYWLASHCRRLLAIPLQRQHGILGCLFAVNKSIGEFDSLDSKLLNSIANESAIFLENAMLYENGHDLMMGLLHSLVSAVDAKDAYTCGHSRRVAGLARQLSVEAHLPDSLSDRIYMAGLLHDIGKIGVPETVLHKTGKLTTEEFAQMKKHPQVGARILNDVKQINDLIPAVLHHHERYDGEGYPEGLPGERIPLMGRIICLADGFDAMTSNRTYRGALSMDVALAEIHRCAGTQFDPTLAEAFFRIGPDRLGELIRSDPQPLDLFEIQPQLRCA